MSLSDPIGDMIARIKNAQQRYHKKIELPSSNFKIKIADVLKNEGFIIDYKVDQRIITVIINIQHKPRCGGLCYCDTESIRKRRGTQSSHRYPSG